MLQNSNSNVYTIPDSIESVYRSLLKHTITSNILIRGFMSNPGAWSRLVQDDLSNFIEHDDTYQTNDEWKDFRGTFLFHDQEPLLYKSQKNQWDKFIFTRTMLDDRLLILHSEINSTELNDFCNDYNAIPIHWFSNGALAYEWYCSDRFRLLETDFQELHQIKYKFSCLNRLIGQQRIYRPILSGILESQIDHRYIKLSCNVTDIYSNKPAIDCIEGRIIPEHHKKILENMRSRESKIAINLPEDIVDDTTLNWISAHLLRGKYFKDVFCHIATETMFYDDAIHLTEKSLRAFVNMRPMILVGPAGSLKYLRNYGFKTFGNFWDESYDDEIDSNKRLDKILELIFQLEKMSLDDMRHMILSMQDVLTHNRENFFDTFPKLIREELLSNIPSSFNSFKERLPNGWAIQRIASLNKKEFDSIKKMKITDDILTTKIFEDLKNGDRSSQDKNVARFLHQHLGLTEDTTSGTVLNQIYQILA